MKKIYGMLLNACGICVLLVCAILAFVSVDSGGVFQMTYPALLYSFLSVFGMSVVIAACGLIFDISVISPVSRIIIHIFALLAALFGVLGWAGFLATRKPSDYFVLVFVYLFLYGVIFFGSRLVRTLYAKTCAVVTDKKNQAKSGARPSAKKPVQASAPKGKINKSAEKKEEYKPLYK